MSAVSKVSSLYRALIEPHQSYIWGSWFLTWVLLFAVTIQYSNRVDVSRAAATCRYCSARPAFSRISRCLGKTERQVSLSSLRCKGEEEKEEEKKEVKKKE